MDPVIQFPVEILEASDNEEIPVDAYLEYAAWFDLDVNNDMDLQEVIDTVRQEYVTETDSDEFEEEDFTSHHYYATDNYIWFRF
jgi:hypothetical protein